MNPPDYSDVQLQPIHVIKGRGAKSNLQGRYEVDTRERIDDGWGAGHDDTANDNPVRTKVVTEVAKSILSRNSSPDIPFNVSLTPYRG
jgi:hypothetical protein